MHSERDLGTPQLRVNILLLRTLARKQGNAQLESKGTSSYCNVLGLPLLLLQHQNAVIPSITAPIILPITVPAITQGLLTLLEVTLSGESGFVVAGVVVIELVSDVLCEPVVIVAC